MPRHGVHLQPLNGPSFVVKSSESLDIGLVRGCELVADQTNVGAWYAGESRHLNGLMTMRAVQREIGRVNLMAESDGLVRSHSSVSPKSQ